MRWLWKYNYSVLSSYWEFEEHSINFLGANNEKIYQFADGSGMRSCQEDVIKNQSIDQIFSPQMSEEDRQAKRKGWNKAVKYAYGWAKDEPEEEEE